MWSRQNQRAKIEYIGVAVISYFSKPLAQITERPPESSLAKGGKRINSPSPYREQD